MKIAIVDDMKQDREKTKARILNYSAQTGVSAICDLFANGEEFLSALKCRRYDLVFLDIFMDGPNGIQIAEHLRKADMNCLLVFLTSSTEHMAEAFLVHAFGYLEKPFCEESLHRILDDALKLCEREKPAVEIPMGKQTVSILYSDILFVTADSNYIEIHADKQYRCRMPFFGFANILTCDSRFLVINRGVLVNLDYVVSMEDLICRLKNGSSFPINRKKESALKQAYITRQFAIRTGKVSKGGLL